MLATERHLQILSILEERGTVRTIDLAEEFNVTDETIRRDFQVLADNDQLTRIHGGARSLTGRQRLQSFTERSTLHIESKKVIAQAALSLIQPDRTYAFDSSTTAFALVASLPNLSYRVVTNSHAVLEQLFRFEQVQLISTGGRYHHKTHTYVGGDSINTLRHHYIDTAFVSSIGFDIERGASEGFEQQATYKERLVQFAKEVVLLIDSSKFAIHSEYYFAEPRNISRIITDSSIPAELATEIRSKGIKLTIAQ